MDTPLVIHLHNCTTTRTHKRPSAEIAQHPWVCDTFTVSCLAHEDNPALVVDPRIMAECVALGFREEDILSALTTRQTNQLTSTYYLLEERLRREAQGHPITAPPAKNDVEMVDASGSLNRLPSMPSIAPSPMAVSDAPVNPPPPRAAPHSAAQHPGSSPAGHAHAPEGGGNCVIS